MKTLVVLRCGDQSLHPNWVNKHANFDVILSYFGNDLKYDLSHIKHVHYFKGSKWEGLYDFFKFNEKLWKSYDYIWLPDDDLDTTVENLNEYFQLNNAHGFALSQPALTHHSYYSHPITLKVNNFIYRETNFVEVMAPCFSNEAFQKCMETFFENQSGWGLDSLWPHILSSFKIGILDKTPIYHTRPVGSAGNGTGNSNTSPQNEFNSLITKYYLIPRLNCFSGLLSTNQFITNRAILFHHICIGSQKSRLSTKKSFQKLYKEVFFSSHFFIEFRRLCKKIKGQFQ